ncbi:DUF5694 domain-containing protein [Galbibacter sp. EGI 63066]|uniref:DUF5694 domain-containing protein n=1 Tax=Galbibacter sp. EGI 63066 TaxID=2993559 RepID=UPI002248FB48|nr:DUF5694 domain-containing protein [Galbibacter sp. EGI 63066]MCX2679379.1 DUF5694 domain-containing protein [Galbibacter sp. EGI 63066]
MKIRLISILLISILIGCKEKYKTENTTTTILDQKKEILLIGTFHYNNPGADVAKTKSFDILSEKSQLELEQISSSIKKYNPTKVFVEWPYNEQNELDSLYQLYKENKYFTNDSLSDFYLKNEIFQLAFRVAKQNNLDKVYGIDYLETGFPYQEVMNDIKSNNQIKLKERIEKSIAQFTADFDNMIESGTTLKELTFAMNTKEMRYASNDIHINMFPVAGSTDEFNGVYLTSEWYKRNLYMWSLIQKNTFISDERVMVLAGSSHTAMIELFVKENRDWKIKELKEIITEK